jgi:cysteine desulfurase/selenocysteine lyase
MCGPDIGDHPIRDGQPPLERLAGDVNQPFREQQIHSTHLAFLRYKILDTIPRTLGQTDVRGEALSYDNLRARFDLDSSTAYFNSASCAPPPRQVTEAMTEYYQASPVNYRSGETPLEKEVTERVDKIRANLSNSIHATSPAEVVFTKNTTEAINIVARGLKWTAGDEVLLTPLEHQSNLIPWLRLALSAGVNVKYVQPVDRSGVIDPQDVARLIGPRTRLLAIHHVSNLLGCTQDIESISAVARNRDILVLVDAAQSEGRVDVDVQRLGCDFVVSCARKGLLGPQGLGFLWGRAALLSEMEPLIIGGQSAQVTDPQAYRALDIPFRHEAGIVNTSGIIGLGAALEFTATVGRQRIYSYLRELTAHVLEGLAMIKGVRVHGPNKAASQPGIVSWTMKGKSAENVARALYEQAQVIVAAGTCGSPLAADFLNVPGVARLSLHCFNSVDEIDRLLDALANIAES